MMLIAGTVSLSAQGYTLKGTVEDIMNEPLIGASVMVKGTSQGTMTDFDGNFSIQVMNGDVLTFSYVGYLAKEITVAGQNDITVVLEEAAQNLNELVVVGYGTARKKDLTGSVAQINPSKFADQNPGTVQDLLRGTPGLQIGYNPDAKGSASIQLRGQNSVYDKGEHNSPLLILDGMQFNGELSEINPDDIQSIDVLKDASAAAIYGAKAASGVIIITTKKGRKGKPVVTISGNWAASTKSAYLDVFGPDEYLKYREDYYKTPTAGLRADGSYGYYSVASGIPDGYFDYYKNVQSMYGVTPEQWANSGTIQIGEKGTMEDVYASRLLLNQAVNVYQNFLNGRKTVDWYDLTFRTGFNQDYNGSVSGATDNVNYYFSVGYLKNEGVIRGNDYESFRA
ncbi:MAG: TonB-dependent receptor plug domain-containing protein, partial [Muribaculaceae bacterium]|nr:TonB-dependent receptor plug domain-containing protein [Muribaculaceae bacterium]